MKEEKTKLEKAHIDLKHEIEKWDVLQVDISTLVPNGGLIKVSHRTDTLILLLIEKGVFTQEEADLKFVQVALENLRQIRTEVVEPAVREAKLQAIKNGTLQ